MSLILNNVTDYIENDMNVILSGPSGTGKTTIAIEACKRAGLKMKYFSGSTMDPYIDFVGIPTVEDTELGKELVMVRPASLEEVEVIFVDEINRAPLAAQNGFFEIAQFGTVNGVELPKLKAVMAAFNPPADGYVGVTEIDVALMERFDAHIVTDGTPDPVYFNTKFGTAVGAALVTWHRAHPKGQGYISPRRLDKIGSAWLKLPRRSTLVDLMPPKTQANITGLFDMLEKTKRAEKLGGAIAERLGLTEAELSDPAVIVASREMISTALPTMSADEITAVSPFIAKALNTGTSGKNLVAEWGDVLTYLDLSSRAQLTEGWTRSKSGEFITECRTRKVTYGRKFPG